MLEIHKSYSHNPGLLDYKFPRKLKLRKYCKNFFCREGGGVTIEYKYWITS